MVYKTARDISRCCEKKEAKRQCSHGRFRFASSCCQLPPHSIIKFFNCCKRSGWRWCQSVIQPTVSVSVGSDSSSKRSFPVVHVQLKCKAYWYYDIYLQYRMREHSTTVGFYFRIIIVTTRKKIKNCNLVSHVSRTLSYH